MPGAAHDRCPMPASVTGLLFGKGTAMRNHGIITLGVFTAAILSCSAKALAGYTGLSVTSTPIVISGQLMNVYHVFATFTDPDDYLTAVFGSPTLGPLVVGSSNGGPVYE